MAQEADKKAKEYEIERHRRVSKKLMRALEKK
jgi:hypothetical protein